MLYKFEAVITEEDFDAMRAVDLTGSQAEADLTWIDVGQPKQEEKPKGGSLAKSAGQMCAELMFQKFLALKYYPDWAGATKGLSFTEIAAHVLRHICNVQSRAELDSNKEAAQRFHKLMREYREWLERQA